MATIERSMTVDSVAAMRSDLKELITAQGLLREEVVKTMSARGMNHAGLARVVDLKSPKRIQDFLDGRYVVSGGKALRSMATFASFPSEMTDRIEAIASQYGTSLACTLTLYGYDAVDFACDIFDAFYRHSTELVTEEFGNVFDGASDLVTRVLNKGFEVLDPFVDPRTKLFSSPDRNEATRHVQALIGNSTELCRRIAERVASNAILFEDMLRRWNEFQAEHGPTQREAAERLGIPKSTISNAVTLTNPYRITSLGAVLEKVDVYLANKAKGLTARRRESKRVERDPTPDASADGGEQVDDDALEGGILHGLGRLKRADIRTLRIEDHKALVDLASEQAHRLIQTLGYLLRVEEDAVLAFARSRLGRPLTELHDSIFLLTSHARLEELIAIVEGEQQLGRSLGDTR